MKLNCPNERKRAPRPPGVLIVDDDEAVRNVVGLGMRAAGLAVWLASGGDEATVLFLEFQPAIDVVLLDVRMPGRNGPETLAALRALDPHVPCCFMSGETGEYTVESLLALGAVAVFQKPFRLRELVEHLRHVATTRELTDRAPECHRGEGEPCPMSDTSSGNC